MESIYVPKFDVLARLTQIREAKGLSVYRLAKISGIPQPTIATWYQKGHYPPIDKLEILCHAMGITLVDFFNTNSECFVASEEDFTVLELYHLLSVCDQELMVTLMDHLLGRKKAK